MERYDIAIIGTGPAGISAAITATIRNKNIVLLGSRNFSEKIEKAHLIENYPGLPEISGEDMADAFRKHLEHLNIEITEEKVKAVYNMGEYFAIQGADAIYESSAVIISTGVNFGRLLPGEKELLGHGVSYCATCDAPLYKNKTAIVVGYYSEAGKEAEFLAEIADRVYYLPAYKNGDDKLKGENIDIISGIPKEVRRCDDGKVKLLAGENEYTADGIFILRDRISPEQLMQELKLDGNHIAVDLQMRTSVEGCFACGDIAGKPYQYIKAAGQGNVAALSAVEYLNSWG